LSAFRQNRIFIFIVALVFIYGSLMIVVSITNGLFMPLVESRGWLEQGFVPEYIARTGIAFIFGFAIFTYGAMLIYGGFGYGK
jgi:hypothetical protein